MTQQEIIQKVLEEKVIAIVRGIETEKCLKVAEALYAGGIRLMEVPFNPKDPAGDQTTADCIAALAKEYEAQGRALIIAPDDICGLDTLKRDREALIRFYQKGYQEAKRISAFLGANPLPAA